MNANIVFLIGIEKLFESEIIENIWYSDVRFRNYFFAVTSSKVRIYRLSVLDPSRYSFFF